MRGDRGGSRTGCRRTGFIDILQTRDGYLWVATDRGLARFDGVKFTTIEQCQYGRTDHQTRFVGYTKRSDGTLWVGTGRGLFRILAGSPTRVQAASEVGEFEDPIAT